jgi:ribonuclease-3
MNSFSDVLGYEFADPDLLVRALTHSSARQSGDETDNERLEFLGDAVLDLVIAEELFTGHPEWREGQLTWTRAALVNTSDLAERARDLGLGGYLRLGPSEQAAGADKDSILAGALEAVLGAVYLDGGLVRVRSLVRRLWADALHPDAAPSPRDAKMRFQEWCHRKYRETPTWRIVEDSGDDGDAERFHAEACLDGRTLGRGSGRTKRDAERAAAVDALAREESDGSAER